MDNLKDLIPENKNIPWTKLKPTLNHKAITNSETLTQITNFVTDDKMFGSEF